MLKTVDIAKLVSVTNGAMTLTIEVTLHPVVEYNSTLKYSAEITAIKKL